jgi:cell shape-determining protein MreD
MKTGLKKFFTSLGIFFVPILSILILELIFYLPRNNNFYNFLRLAPIYSGIYFWLSLRKDIFNIFSVFILGIIADVITSTIIGINILTFLFLYIISSKMFTYFNIRHFTYSWLLFATSLFLSLAFKAITISIFYKSLPPLSSILFEYILISTLYPLIARFYLYTELRFIHLEASYENQ